MADKKYEPMSLGEKIRSLTPAEKEAYVEHLNSDKYARVWCGDKPVPNSRRWSVVESDDQIEHIPKTTLQKEIDAVDMNSEKMQKVKSDYLAFEKRRAELSKDHDDSCPHCGTPEMFDFELPPELEKMLSRIIYPLSSAEKHVLEMELFKDEFLEVAGVNKELLGPAKNPTAKEQETLDLLRGKKKK